MPMYDIEMGQGLTAPASTFQVVTSALYSCTLIGAHGATRAGAYHYPSKGLTNESQDIIKDMNDWIEDIEPNQMVFVFAEGSGIRGDGTGTDPYDRRALLQWGRQKCQLVREAKATRAIVSVAQNTVDAGQMSDFPNFHAQKMNLRMKPAGVYILQDKPEFTLWGKNREV